MANRIMNYKDIEFNFEEWEFGGDTNDGYFSIWEKGERYPSDIAVINPHKLLDPEDALAVAKVMTSGKDLALSFAHIIARIEGEWADADADYLRMTIKSCCENAISRIDRKEAS